MDWTAGYVSDVAYTHGYYGELNPLRIRLALLHAGLVPPQINTACELGFGQGVTLNIHAAGGTVAWHGTDFLPAQAAFAKEMAAAAQHGAQIFDQSFEEFCSRDDLPEFDFICLHGIWSWISDENRSWLLDFFRRKLKVGGVLFVSYNCFPGWAPMVPVQSLMAQHGDLMTPVSESSVARVGAAIDFVDELLAVNPLFLKANPQISERMKAIKTQNRTYVAHEYFNRHWVPMAFADHAKLMESAKLQWACSATLLDNIDLLNLTAEQQALLAKISNPIFKQTVRDFCINQQFRRDYWIKGARSLTVNEQARMLREERLVLATTRADVPATIKGPVGEASLQPAVYGPILDLMADNKPRTLGEMEQALASQALAEPISFAQLLQAVFMLSSNGTFQAAQSDEAIAAARSAAHRLNAHLCAKARGSAETPYLASPVTGGGVQVPRFNQMFLASYQQGRRTAPEMAADVWQVLSGQGEVIVKDGKALETPEANLAELEAQAQGFLGKQLPFLVNLQVI